MVFKANFITNLKDRKQRTLNNDQEFGRQKIVAEVPQGSGLGTQLFLLYINDLSDKLVCSPKLFADDVSLNGHMNSISASARKFKNDLKHIEEWLYRWKTFFNPNPKKTANEVVFSNRIQVIHSSLQFAEKMIKSVKSQKHLGLILYHRRDFNLHLKEKIGKDNTGF